MTRLLARALIALERDDVFGPLQIIILPGLLFLGCMVAGG